MRKLLMLLIERLQRRLDNQEVDPKEWDKICKRIDKEILIHKRIDKEILLALRKDEK